MPPPAAAAAAQPPVALQLGGHQFAAPAQAIPCDAAPVPHADGRAAGAPLLQPTEVKAAASALRNTGVNPTSDLHAGSDAKKAAFAAERRVLEDIYTAHQGDWPAMAAAVPAQYFVGAAALAKQAPKNAGAFVYGVTEGCYFEVSS